MKIRESCLQTGNFIYKLGISLTKQDFHLQMGSLGLQRGFSGYYLPLADFLPTLTIAAKNLATEMTNYNVEEKDLQGETAITVEHVENNTSVRDMLGQRGIKPENLPVSEDIKKLERRVKREEKKLAEQSGKLTNE